LGSQLWGLDFHTRGLQDRNLKLFFFFFFFLKEFILHLFEKFISKTIWSFYTTKKIKTMKLRAKGGIDFTIS
jgi:hypothetical protein